MVAPQISLLGWPGKLPEQFESDCRAELREMKTALHSEVKQFNSESFLMLHKVLVTYCITALWIVYQKMNKTEVCIAENQDK